jgi:hypothetical protein
MNKYIVPICDIQNGSVWIEVILSKSLSDCHDKLIDNILENYSSINDNFQNYEEFVGILDSKYDIIIGDIRDIEEL